LKVTDEVYALDSTKGNYSYLIRGEETILVDTGRPGQGKGILNDLSILGIKPEDIRHILITHHDVDYVGSLLFFKMLLVLKSGHPRKIFPISMEKKAVQELKN